MADEVIARRYADGFLGVATDPDDLERLYAELKVVRESFHAAPGLHGLFMNPVIKESEKEAIITRVFKGRVDDRVYNFLRSIFRRRRVPLFDAVVGFVREGLDRRKMRHKAVVVSAIVLPEEVRARIQKRLEAITAYTLRMKFHEDPAILGGLHVRIDDVVIDARLSRSLTELQARLTDNRLLLALADRNGETGR